MVHNVQRGATAYHLLLGDESARMVLEVDGVQLTGSDFARVEAYWYLVQSNGLWCLI